MSVVGTIIECVNCKARTLADGAAIACASCHEDLQRDIRELRMVERAAKRSEERWLFDARMRTISDEELVACRTALEKCDAFFSQARTVRVASGSPVPRSGAAILAEEAIAKWRRDAARLHEARVSAAQSEAGGAS